MPGPIFTVGNTTICPHGGQVQAVPATPRVLCLGLPAVTVADLYPIAGCVFALPAGPHPCTLVQWTTPALRVFVMGVPVVLQTSVGLCLAPDQAPQGPPAVIVNQPRVVAT